MQCSLSAPASRGTVKVIPIARPLLDSREAEAVQAVLASGQLAQGERVHEFEVAFARFCGAREAVAVSSGTAALIVALMAHGIGPDDEVITTPFTFIATANAIIGAGARPVFADILEDDFNIDPEDVARRITTKTRAIIPVHLYGHPCRIEEIMDIASSKGIAVIEDACQSHGAASRGRRVGSFSTGCFSFYPTKNMTTGEGGMITTDDPSIAAAARLLREHGATAPYRHEHLGFNWRMTDIAAAIGLVQLAKLPHFNEQRRANASYLGARLKGVALPSERPGCSHVYHQYTIRAPGYREELIDYLRENGVGTGVYYPAPIHHQPLYQKMGYDDHLPLAERASREVLSLPVHPGLAEEDRTAIVQAVNSFSPNAVSSIGRDEI